MDIVSKSQRSRMMSGIRSKNTKPELLVRRELHRRGYRFRLHDKKLPGKPDIVLPKYKTVIFVNGCFWHQHPKCKLVKLPSTNRKFWRAKLTANVARDRMNIEKLRRLGWRSEIVWACQLGSARSASAEMVRIILNLQSPFPPIGEAIQTQ